MLNLNREGYQHFINGDAAWSISSGYANTSNHSYNSPYQGSYYKTGWVFLNLTEEEVRDWVDNDGYVNMPAGTMWSGDHLMHADTSVDDAGNSYLSFDASASRYVRDGNGILNSSSDANGEVRAQIGTSYDEAISDGPWNYKTGKVTHLAWIRYNYIGHDGSIYNLDRHKFMLLTVGLPGENADITLQQTTFMSGENIATFGDGEAEFRVLIAPSRNVVSLNDDGEPGGLITNPISHSTNVNLNDTSTTSKTVYVDFVSGDYHRINFLDGYFALAIHDGNKVAFHPDNETQYEVRTYNSADELVGTAWPDNFGYISGTTDPIQANIELNIMNNYAITFGLAPEILPNPIVLDGTEFPVNSYDSGHQYAPFSETLPDGGVIVVWYGQDPAISSETGVFCQFYDVNGAKDGNEIQINTTMIDGEQEMVKVSIVNDLAIATWRDHRDTTDTADGTPSTSHWQTWAQNISLVSKQPTGENYQVSQTPTDHNYSGSAGQISEAGDYVIVWHSNVGVKSRAYNADGTPKVTYKTVTTTIPESTDSEGVVTPESTTSEQVEEIAEVVLFNHSFTNDSHIRVEGRPSDGGYNVWLTYSYSPAATQRLYYSSVNKDHVAGVVTDFGAEIRTFDITKTDTGFAVLCGREDGKLTYQKMDYFNDTALLNFVGDRVELPYTHSGSYGVAIAKVNDTQAFIAYSASVPDAAAVVSSNIVTTILDLETGSVIDYTALANTATDGAQYYPAISCTGTAGQAIITWENREAKANDATVSSIFGQLVKIYVEPEVPTEPTA